MVPIIPDVSEVPVVFFAVSGNSLHWFIIFREYEKCVLLCGRFTLKLFEETEMHVTSTVFMNFHSCTVHLDTVESFIYPTDTQPDCSKNVKIYIKIYMRGAATCFDFSQPSSGSYCMCFAKFIIINNQLKYVVYRISSV